APQNAAGTECIVGFVFCPECTRQQAQTENDEQDAEYELWQNSSAEPAGICPAGGVYYFSVIHSVHGGFYRWFLRQIHLRNRPLREVRVPEKKSLVRPHFVRIAF